MSKTRTTLFQAILATLMLTLVCQADPSSGALAVLENHRKAKEKLEDLQAKVALQLDLVLGILPYTEKLTGQYYYKHPNKHKVKLNDPPAYLDDAPSLFDWKLPNLEKYSVKKGPTLTRGTATHHALLYTPKNPGSNTRTIKCTFEEGNWRLIAQDTSYQDGGAVNLRFFYLDDSELPVLDKVKASVSIPSYKLTGEAKIDFSSQQTNQGLEDSLFAKSK